MPVSMLRRSASRNCAFWSATFDCQVKGTKSLTHSQLPHQVKESCTSCVNLGNHTVTAVLKLQAVIRATRVWSKSFEIYRADLAGVYSEKSAIGVYASVPSFFVDETRKNPAKNPVKESKRSKKDSDDYDVEPRDDCFINVTRPNI